MMSCVCPGPVHTCRSRKTRRAGQTAVPTGTAKPRHSHSLQQRVALVAAVAAALLSVVGAVAAAHAKLSQAVVTKAHTILKQSWARLGTVGDPAGWLPAKNAARTLDYWWQRFFTSGTVKDNQAGTSHMRLYSINDEELQECIDEMNRRNVFSMREAELYCPTVQSIMQRTGCTIEYLFARLRGYCPAFKKGGRVEPRPPMSAQLKKTRLEYLHTHPTHSTAFQCSITL